MIGTLINFRADRGYGFISHNDGSRGRTFVHLMQLRKAGIEDPTVGMRLEFDIEQLKDDRFAAANLRLLS